MGSKTPFVTAKPFSHNPVCHRSTILFYDKSAYFGSKSPFAKNEKNNY